MSPASLWSTLLRLGLAAGLTLAAGCGGDGDDGGGKATCSSTAAAICAAACTCGGGAGCSIGDETGSITFDNKQDCLSLYALACGQPSPNVDYDACATALKTPECVASTDGMALKTPAACNEPNAQ
jgi:hypothetical protein